jgi:hypothetical protein
VDWIESLLPLLIFAIYLLSQLRSRRKPSAPAPEDAVEPAPSRPPTSFEELIRQIQQAAEAKQAEPARPIPEPIAVPTPAPVPPARIERVDTEFRPLGGFPHEQHGFDESNPFSEEAFERLPQDPPPPAHAPGHLDYDPHGLRQPPTPVPPPAHASIIERLRQPGGAQDALVIQAILERPRQRSRRR